MVEDWRQAFIDIAFVGFRLAEPQILLGLLVLTGVIYTLLRREHLWISVSYAIICALYALSSSTDGHSKNVLTGFWYHHSYRLGAWRCFWGGASRSRYLCVPYSSSALVASAVFGFSAEV